MAIYSWITHKKWWFSVAMLVYQRVTFQWLFPWHPHPFSQPRPRRWTPPAPRTRRTGRCWRLRALNGRSWSGGRDAVCSCGALRRWCGWAMGERAASPWWFHKPKVGISATNTFGCVVNSQNEPKSPGSKLGVGLKIDKVLDFILNCPNQNQISILAFSYTWSCPASPTVCVG
jgi:hypothetical protein